MNELWIIIINITYVITILSLISIQNTKKCIYFPTNPLGLLGNVSI